MNQKTSIDFKQWTQQQIAFVETKIQELLPSKKTPPTLIHESMHYSLYAGGKRLRPLLCFAAAEACGGAATDAAEQACAIECLHTYSLIHDDLPCMDDDDLRRGKPTNHVVYGENIAVLAGDALLTQSFQLLCQAKETPLYSVKNFVQELANSANSQNLIGGQVLDLQAEAKPITQTELEQIHRSKTAALIKASLRLGGMSANASKNQLQILSEIGENLGLAFQVIDDVLDATQATEHLGKTANKDLHAKKATYPLLIGLEASKKEAQRLTNNALKALTTLSPQTQRLQQLANYMLQRTF